MTTTDLKKILDAHREWAAGNGGERANLSGAGPILGDACHGPTGSCQ
jgi:hypothetical protein